MDDEENVFEAVDSFPNAEALIVYQGLVGLDEEKSQLVKESSVLLNRSLLDDWSKQNHKRVIPLVDFFKKRAPLFIFAGDVGTGKTTLAETFGAAISDREKNMSINLYRLSLNARGSGLVGQMSKLISNAFEEIRKTASEIKINAGRPSSGIIFFIDEADALAQSREFQQMHHEDKAGVNSLIRGIDTLSKQGLPVIIVMCTNRFDSLDPAVVRRAAAIFQFKRPSKEQRKEVIKQNLDGIGLKAAQIEKIADLMGSTKDRTYGWTYSDMRLRFFPSLVIDAFPDTAITFDRIVELAQAFEPAKPFTNEKSNA
jgi:AAA+ superfamily predicted ATPase